MKPTRAFLSLLLMLIFSVSLFATETSTHLEDKQASKTITKTEVKKETKNKTETEKTNKKEVKAETSKIEAQNKYVQQLYTTQVKPAEIKAGAEDKGILANGLFWAFLIVLLGGFLTSLTPCAFPVILISMPALMKKEGSKKYKFSISLTYVLGIATMYSSLGIFAALSGSAIGALMQNPWVIGAFILFFLAMGLSSLGAFILQMPSGLTTKMTGASEGSGYPKAYISGLFLGIIAAPCVGPVLAGVLAYIAQTKDVMLGFLLLTTFAFGMGILILIIGTFSPQWKSGSWMEKVNTLFGILLFLAAFYFLKDVLPIVNEPFNLLYAAVGYNTLVFILIAIGIIGVGYAVGPFKFEEMFMLEGLEKLRKLVGAIIISIGLFMIAGVLLFFKTETKFHWEKPNTAMIQGDANFKKMGIPQKLIDKAIQEKKGIMIDFSGQGCAACAELKRHTFSNSEVAKHIKENFVPIYLYYTDSDEDEVVYAPMDEAFGVNYQWPTVLFIDKAGRLRKDVTLKGFENAEKFLKRMKKVQ